MSKKDYWGERVRQGQEAVAKKQIAETEKQMRKYYNNAMRHVMSDFENTFHKVFDDVADGYKPTPADLYKLDAYWQSQAMLQRELTKLGDKQAKLLAEQFYKTWKYTYNNVALPTGGLFGSIDNATVRQMINSIWCADGLTWSQRIWKNTANLQELLNEGLLDCVLTGKSPTALKEMLTERFNVSFNQADMLVRTEIAHIQTQAATQRYKDAGLEYVEIWADEDERRCKHCGKLHEKRYLVGETVPIPAHPRCRCVVLPVIE